MSVWLKLRTYEFLGKNEYFRRMALRKQFKTYVMVDPDGEAVEYASRAPDYFSAAGNERSMSYYTKEGGSAGYDELAYPDPPIIYGNLTSAQFKPGKVEAECVPSFVPSALTRVEVQKDCVVFSQRGIGGVPDMIRLWASSARRVVETPLKTGGTSFDIEYPIRRKVVIGLDDTDSSVKGATFSTALQIASLLGKAMKDVTFLRMTISLNWPQNPNKTTNNASSALVFAVRPGKEEKLVSQFEKLVRKHTISKETGMAVMNKVRAPEPLKAYAMKVKSVQVDVSETYKVAEQTGVKPIPITGERGLIGAFSAVGLVDDSGTAIVPIGNSNSHKP